MQRTLNARCHGTAKSEGQFQQYEARDISPGMSFLEMLDEGKEGLIENGKEPIAFDHDSREGICVMCSAMINGVPHGPDGGTTTSQLHVRSFMVGETVVIGPWRATALPMIRDLVVDRPGFFRIVQAGGFVSVSTGSAPDASLTPAAKIAHLRRMPQRQQEQSSRARAMVDQMDAEGFGGCTNSSDCEAARPKESSVDCILEMNADCFRAALNGT